jgi:hypothetical protein
MGDYPFSLIFIWGTAAEKKAFRDKQKADFEKELAKKWE